MQIEDIKLAGSILALTSAVLVLILSAHRLWQTWRHRGKQNQDDCGDYLDNINYD